MNGLTKIPELDQLLLPVTDNGDDVDLLGARALFYTLAALWNEPPEVEVEASYSNGVLDLRLEYPAHLRSERLFVEASPELVAWTPVAHNTFSTELSPVVGSAEITTTEIGDILRATVRYDIDGAAANGPLPVLINGDFEIGWPVGWLTSGSTTSDCAEGGSRYSLRLEGNGGYSTPTAYHGLPAGPGDECRLSGWMLTPVALPPNGTNGLLKIVFLDAQGNDLVPASVCIGQVTASFPGAESLPILTDSSTPGVWHFTEAQAVAPSETASVRFFAINVDASAATMHFEMTCPFEAVLMKHSKVTTTDLRLMIEKCFRETGCSVPFPQRDIISPISPLSDCCRTVAGPMDRPAAGAGGGLEDF